MPAFARRGRHRAAGGRAATPAFALPAGYIRRCFASTRGQFVAGRPRAMTAVWAYDRLARNSSIERSDHDETSRNIRRGGGPAVPGLRPGAGAELAEPAGEDHRSLRRRRRRRYFGPDHRRPPLHRVPPAVLRREPRRRRRHGRRGGRCRGRARRLYPRRLQHRVERDLAGVQRQCRLRRAARFHPHRLSGRAAGGHDRASLARGVDLQGLRRARAAEQGADELHFPGYGLARISGRRNIWRGRRATKSATSRTKARVPRSPTWWPGTSSSAP